MRSGVDNALVDPSVALMSFSSESTEAVIMFAAVGSGAGRTGSGRATA